MKIKLIDLKERARFKKRKTNYGHQNDDGLNGEMNFKITNRRL